MFLIEGFSNEIVCFVTKPILILNDHVTFSVLDRLWYPLYAAHSSEVGHAVSRLYQSLSLFLDNFLFAFKSRCREKVFAK